MKDNQYKKPADSSTTNHQEQKDSTVSVAARDTNINASAAVSFFKSSDSSLRPITGPSAPTTTKVDERQKGNVITGSQGVTTGSIDNSQGKIICVML